jgi:hypothetical protein
MEETSRKLRFRSFPSTILSSCFSPARRLETTCRTIRRFGYAADRTHQLPPRLCRFSMEGAEVRMGRWAWRRQAGRRESGQVALEERGERRRADRPREFVPSASFSSSSQPSSPDPPPSSPHTHPFALSTGSKHFTPAGGSYVASYEGVGMPSSASFSSFSFFPRLFLILFWLETASEACLYSLNPYTA